MTSIENNGPLRKDKNIENFIMIGKKWTIVMLFLFVGQVSAEKIEILVLNNFAVRGTITFAAYMLKEQFRNDKMIDQGTSFIGAYVYQCSQNSPQFLNINQPIVFKVNGVDAKAKYFSTLEGRHNYDMKHDYDYFLDKILRSPEKSFGVQIYDWERQPTWLRPYSLASQKITYANTAVKLIYTVCQSGKLIFSVTDNTVEINLETSPPPANNQCKMSVEGTPTWGQKWANLDYGRIQSRELQATTFYFVDSYYLDNTKKASFSQIFQLTTEPEIKKSKTKIEKESEEEKCLYLVEVYNKKLNFLTIFCDENLLATSKAIAIAITVNFLPLKVLESQITVSDKGRVVDIPSIDVDIPCVYRDPAVALMDAPEGKAKLLIVISCSNFAGLAV